MATDETTELPEIAFETAGEHVATGVPSTSPEKRIADVRRALEGRLYETVTAVAVVDDGRLVGLIRIEDLLAAPGNAPAGEGAFLVSWVLTEILRVGRARYVGALAALTGGLTAGYVAWTGAGARFWVERWAWGVLGAAVAGVLLARVASRIPTSRRPGGVSGAVSAWEGVVYGSAEGLLLSVLPVAATWQMFAALGWTGGWSGAGARSAAVAASAGVIIVHHLGYREYRGRAIRGPLVACTVLSVAYLATANPMAAMGGHLALHLAMLRRGLELPPHARSAPSDIGAKEVRPEELAVGPSRAG